MTKDDLERFSQIMAVINEVFGNPDRPISDLKMDFYFQTLSDLTIEQLNSAAINLANNKTITVFPTPGQIREAVFGEKGTRAVRAFDQLISTVRKHGAYKTVAFEDKAIMAAIERLGGWIKLCDATTDEWKWIEKDFYKIYQVYEGKDIDAPASLPGIHEQGNFAKGLTIENPTVFVPAHTEKQKQLEA
jgi:hypothetical protein